MAAIKLTKHPHIVIFEVSDINNLNLNVLLASKSLQ